MPDILDPSALLTLLPSLLPPSSSLQSPQDAIVVLIHTCLSALAFRLVGTDDSNTLATYHNNNLPEDWNAHGPGHYTLRYRHEQSSLEFVVKVSKLGARTVVNAIATESNKATSLDIRTEDYTSPSFFPCRPLEPGAQPLVHGFISSNRITDFIQSFKFTIVQKLVPGLRKEGYTEVNEDRANSSSSSQTQTQQQQQQQQQQQRPRPQAPRVPTLPYEERDPFGLRPSHIPPENPLSIGRRDLDPIPSHPNPLGPPPLFGDPLRGDGMIVGPGHPIFSDRFTPGRGGGIGGRGQHEGPWGGDGYLPPMGAPPGARFDPVGPFGARGPFGGRPGGRGGGHQNLGEPNNDEFMPPGAGDMFS